jgi:hypothetical protein
MKWKALLQIVAVALSLAAPVSRAEEAAAEDMWSHTVEFEDGLFSMARYDAAERSLTLVFRHGATYVYYDIHPDDFSAFLAADSKARYFNENFRRFHHFERMSRYVASACRSEE